MVVGWIKAFLRGKGMLEFRRKKLHGRGQQCQLVDFTGTCFALTGLCIVEFTVIR